MPSCDPVGAEVLVLDFCADDVPVGDQDVVADRADGFEGAAPSSDGVIARTQIGVFGTCGGCAASVSTVLSATGPWRVRPDRALPPEALVPGHIPAQDAGCAGVANTLMSTPTPGEVLIDAAVQPGSQVLGRAAKSEKARMTTREK